MDATTAGYEFGKSLAAAAHGIGRDEMLRRGAMHRVMSSPEGVPFERQLCKLAMGLFEAAGDTHSPGYMLFENLEKSAVWHSSYNRFTDHVRRALAGHGDLQKEAMGLLPAAAALHESTGGGILKTLVAGGALTGVTGGSLAFLLSRNAEQSSSENAILMEKIRAYRKLKRDIEEDMANDVAAAPASKPSRSHYNV